MPAIDNADFQKLVLGSMASALGRISNPSPMFEKVWAVGKEPTVRFQYTNGLRLGANMSSVEGRAHVELAGRKRGTE